MGVLYLQEEEYHDGEAQDQSELVASYHGQSVSWLVCVCVNVVQC